MGLNSELLLGSSNLIGITATDPEKDLGYDKLFVIPAYYLLILFLNWVGEDGYLGKDSITRSVI